MVRLRRVDLQRLQPRWHRFNGHRKGPEALAIGVPEMLHDLPAAGKRLVQRARGYRATIVEGEVIARDGELTGALPGRLVRGGRTAPTQG